MLHFVLPEAVWRHDTCELWVCNHEKEFTSG
jgi:hypothetical protein